MKFIVVDNDPLTLHMVGYQLSQLGHEVIPCPDGDSAWKVLEDGTIPNMAIIDWSMPGVNGPDLCQKIRARTDCLFLYIILLTARNNSEDLIAGIDAGANDYLTKPILLGELKARLRAGKRIVDLQNYFLSQKAFRSCFISYSTKDEEFASCLFNDLKKKGVRVWYAAEEMKGGDKLYDQIDSAIREHDKLLLILSEESLKSEWVLTEIRRCRKTEKREGKRKLFPIRLVDMETIKNWECFDADSGKDLAVEIRELFIPDFSHWKDHVSYKKSFDRLLRDLQESVK